MEETGRTARRGLAIGRSLPAKMIAAIGHSNPELKIVAIGRSDRRDLAIDLSSLGRTTAAIDRSNQEPKTVVTGPTDRRDPATARSSQRVIGRSVRRLTIGVREATAHSSLGPKIGPIVPSSREPRIAVTVRSGRAPRTGVIGRSDRRDLATVRSSLRVIVRSDRRVRVTGPSGLKAEAVAGAAPAAVDAAPEDSVVRRREDAAAVSVPVEVAGRRAAGEAEAVKGDHPHRPLSTAREPD